MDDRRPEAEADPIHISVSECPPALPRTRAPRGQSIGGLGSAELADFYARQVELLDSGGYAPWSMTFTVDGTVTNASRGTTVAGRPEIAAQAARIGARRADGLARHELELASVRPLDEAAATVVHRVRLLPRAAADAPGGDGADGGSRPGAARMLWEDRLVVVDGGFLVAERRMTPEPGV